VPGHEDPLERRLRDAIEEPLHRSTAADVADAHRLARLGDVEQVEPERLGDPLATPATETIGDPDDARGPVQAAKLRRPPPLRRRQP